VLGQQGGEGEATRAETGEGEETGLEFAGQRKAVGRDGANGGAAFQRQRLCPGRERGQGGGQGRQVARMVDPCRFAKRAARRRS